MPPVMVYFRMLSLCRRDTPDGTAALVQSGGDTTWGGSNEMPYPNVCTASERGRTGWYDIRRILDNYHLTLRTKEAHYGGGRQLYVLVSFAGTTYLCSYYFHQAEERVRVSHQGWNRGIYKSEVVYPVRGVKCASEAEKGGWCHC